MVTDECKPSTRIRNEKVYIEASPCVTQAADLHKPGPAPFFEALDDLAKQGRLTPCQTDPDPFTSDDRDERSEAAQACRMCPLLTACATHADTSPEVWFVWGGIDRTDLSRKTKP